MSRNSRIQIRVCSPDGKPLYQVSKKEAEAMVNRKEAQMVDGKLYLIRQ